MKHLYNSKLARVALGIFLLGLVATATWVTRHEKLAVRGDIHAGIVVERNRYTGVLKVTSWAQGRVYVDNMKVSEYDY